MLEEFNTHCTPSKSQGLEVTGETNDLTGDRGGDNRSLIDFIKYQEGCLETMQKQEQHISPDG